MTAPSAPAALPVVRRRSKYGSRKVVSNGITFDSAKEANRYAVLKMLEQAGQIQSLMLQVSYDIEVNGVKVCKVIPDFVYTKNGKIVVEDCKGFRTPVYRLKAKLFKAMYGFSILET